MRNLAWALLFTSLCFVAAHAAIVVGPPVEAALAPEHVVARMRVIGAADRSHQVFEHLHVFHGAGDGQLALRLGRSTDAPAPGNEVIVAYSYARSHPLHRHKVEDRNDPYVVELPGVGAAIFPASPILERLFRQHLEPPDDASAALDNLFGLLAPDNDEPTQRLAAMELQMHTELYPALLRRHSRALAAIVRPRTLPPRTQQMLIVATRQMGSGRRARWLPATCRATLDEAGVELDLGSYVPLLLISCSQVLQGEAKQRDADRLTRMLGSNAPGVGKAALRALIAVDAQSARGRVRRALAAGTLHPETGRAAEAWLRDSGNAARL